GALATARELGMDGLVAKVRRLGLDAAPTAGAQEPADGEAVFRNEGDVWTVIYAGTSVRLRHSKGLGDIAILLANRGRDIHVADLIAASAGAPPDPRSTPAADLVAQGLRVSRGASGDAVLDHRARADYRERLAGLHRELEDAERCNDEGRVARARAEFDFIAGELASAFGLGGRGRRAALPSRDTPAPLAIATRFLAPPGQGLSPSGEALEREDISCERDSKASQSPSWRWHSCRRRQVGRRRIVAPWCARGVAPRTR